MKDPEPKPTLETEKTLQRILIEGVTEEGKTFRPADWAERVSGSLSTFQKRRITYSPMLQPVYKSGYKCVAIDPKLKEIHPELYQSLLDFAKSNHLKICQEENPDSHK